MSMHIFYAIKKTAKFKYYVVALLHLLLHLLLQHFSLKLQPPHLKKLICSSCSSGIERNICMTLIVIILS